MSHQEGAIFELQSDIPMHVLDFCGPRTSASGLSYQGNTFNTERTVFFYKLDSMQSSAISKPGEIHTKIVQFFDIETETSIKLKIIQKLSDLQIPDTIDQSSIFITQN